MMFRPDRGEPARAAPAPVFGWRMIALVAVVTVVAFYLLVLRGGGEVVQDGMVKDALAATATDAGASSSVARMVDSPRGDIWEDLRPDTQQLVRARLGDSPALLVEESLPGKGVMTRLPDRYRPVTVGQLQGDRLVVGEVLNVPSDGAAAANARPLQVSPQVTADTTAGRRHYAE